MYISIAPGFCLPLQFSLKYMLPEIWAYNQTKRTGMFTPILRQKQWLKSHSYKEYKQTVPVNRSMDSCNLQNILQ